MLVRASVSEGAPLAAGCGDDASSSLSSSAASLIICVCVTCLCENARGHPLIHTLIHTPACQTPAQVFRLARVAHVRLRPSVHHPHTRVCLGAQAIKRMYGGASRAGQCRPKNKCWPKTQFGQGIWALGIINIVKIGPRDTRFDCLALLFTAPHYSTPCPC